MRIAIKFVGRLTNISVYANNHWWNSKAISMIKTSSNVAEPDFSTERKQA